MTSSRRRARDNAKRGRTLHLHLEVLEVPPGLSRDRMIDALQAGIRRGEYRLPPGLELELHWKNGDNPATPWRHDPYETAMGESSESGRGFDKAVFYYLESQRREPRERRRGN